MADTKATGLCYFYTDLSDYTTLSVPSLYGFYWRPHIGVSGSRRDPYRVLGAGDLLLSEPSPLVLFPPCSLPCPKVSPGTQEAASEAPNSPPIVRRRGRNGSLLKGLRPPMMQKRLLDTTV